MWNGTQLLISVLLSGLKEEGVGNQVVYAVVCAIKYTVWCPQ
jgi:hypothetical protein